MCLGLVVSWRVSPLAFVNVMLTNVLFAVLRMPRMFSGVGVIKPAPQVKASC